MSEAQQPAFGIQKIYLKDMSLEIPNAPQIFLERESPQVDVSLHNAARPLGQPGLFEVVLTITVTAKMANVYSPTADFAMPMGRKPTAVISVPVSMGIAVAS